MQKYIITGAISGLLALGVSSSSVLAENVAFSADAVELRAGSQMRSGRLYVGSQGTRIEYQQQGRPVVQISLRAKKTMLVLFPLQRAYLKFKTPKGKPTAANRPDAPCKPGPQLDCKGPEFTTIGGISATLWKIKPKGARQEMRVWWDPQRKMPLREEYVDGRVMQATMRGREKFEDRKVESWEFNFMSPNGTYERTISLFAPDLGIAVVEKLPGGIMRRLHNIAKGEPDAKLFEVPEGYKLIERPKPALNRPTANKPPRMMPPHDQMHNGSQMPQTGQAQNSNPAHNNNPAQNNPAMWNNQGTGQDSGQISGQISGQARGGEQGGQFGNRFAGPGAPPRIWPGSGNARSRNARPGTSPRIWPGSGNARPASGPQNGSATSDRSGGQTQ